MIDLRRCLSIRAPWSWIIVRPDLPTGSAEREAWRHSPAKKSIENRSWTTTYRGEIFIHSGLAVDRQSLAAIREAWPHAELPLPAQFPLGGIIGKARLVNVVQAHESLWFTGPYGWVLEDVEPVPFEPMPGRLGLFRAGDAIKSSARRSSKEEEAAAQTRGWVDVISRLPVTTPDLFGQVGQNARERK